ncbi:hypothetical protein G6F62_004033 [Rhizopus arrhizus]|nr:hypothetical protein G6F23_005782 [Rhizopus arrhizus]KAG0758482.1 hypothetical protein G6F24_009767 [Rhizopus arrhizus]KAG0784779.1 hypothetical protein G6F21_009694 [Rhizopus arrhizus]KAG0798861.1 hypothetical protein G6F22_003801 [Rhizopus arrhizus]KAG0807584.1 hypothetical protein G6F20_010250 [Rhizopus arrhizus]
MQEQEVFPSILDVLPLHFAIEFALEANGQKIISFERFLQQRADIQGDTFVQDCLDYLSQKILAETASRQQGFNTTKPDVPAPLSNKELGIFLKVMSNSVTSPHQLEQIIQLQNQFLLLYPDFSTMIDGLKTPVSEEEANAYYERLYTGRLSVDEMVNLLKGLKKSEGTREQQLFECMINVLFDEYPFFSKYPEKELAITSTLFGQLIQQDVMHATQIDRALLYTLEAFRYPANIKMTDFGVQALSQFEYRLSEWPQFCLNVLQLPGFVDSQPRLANIIKASQKVKQRQPKVISHIPIACIKLPSLSKSTMLEMDEYVKLSNPDQATQDRISSIISYLAFDNIGNKIEELKKLLSPMHYQWFSKHLVNKYIPSKQDLHALYAAVLESISSKLLDTFILYETFSSILASLNSSTISFGPIDHTILNNLGSWLGRITLAKNKPILDKHMAFKELLLQGYDTQRLITIIPFACKILEQGSNGKVFIPPNPWLMAVLGLLAEMYHFASLTTDLKADIEKLCDSLSTKIKDINISSLLRSRMVKTNDPNPDGDIDSAYQNRTEVILSLNPSSFAFNIIINPQVPLDVTNATVREWIAQSFIQSISEACDSSIEYAARVSAITTRDIVLKDFVKEQDELKMRNAAHNMVQALAANLVLTSTNQFLEATVSKNLKRVLLALGLSNNVAEQSTILIIADNLSLLNSTIQTMAMDRATAKINNALASEFANRKKYCEQWSGNSLVDPANEPQYVKFLSWAPQPSLNGAQPSQLNIYEDFSVPTFIDHSTYYSADRSTSSNTNILDSRLNQKHGDKISTSFENAFNRTTTNNTKNNL